MAKKRKRRAKRARRKSQTVAKRLAPALRLVEPEHYHCPVCNTVLKPHSQDSDYHFCSNCYGDFLIIEGDVLSEVA